MSKWPKLEIYMLVGNTGAKYIIIETYLSSEGPRTRVVSGSHTSFAVAQGRLAELNSGLFHK